jgi:hypothetical protein
MISCSQSNLNNIDKSSPTNFQLVFPKIPTESSISALNPLKMNIYGVIIPSITISEENLHWQGNKMKNSLIPMDYSQWNVNFVVDSNFDNWSILFRWMSHINNNNDKIAERHKNFSVDCSMVVTDNYANSILEIMFISVWPSNLGDVSFNTRDADVLLEGTVMFNYDYYKINS